ncbi:MAG TPA: SbcC/MukB-like Walker B domain-containing protein, partial [Chondromyces sp.]|nr:SbcC/MukB-like Walker B domain-containing protein [Chondromyces sp.]
KKQVESELQERTRLIKSIQSHSEEMTLLLQKEEINEKEVMEQLKLEIRLLNEKAAILRNQLDDKQKERDEWQKKYAQAENILRQLEQKDVLEKQLNELEKQKEAIREKQSQVDWAEKAVKLHYQEQTCFAISNQKKEMEKRLHTIEHRLKQEQEKLVRVQERWQKEQEREPEREQITAEINWLQSLQAEVYSYAEEKTLLAKMESQLKKEEERRLSLTTAIEKIEQQIEQREESMKILDSLQKKYYQAERGAERAGAAVKQLNRILDLQSECLQWQKEEKKLRDFVEHKLQIFEDHKETVRFLEERWQEHQAGILASQLASDSPCPVCGSLHHPKPAAKGGEVPSEEELKAAKAAMEASERDKAGAERKLLAMQTKADNGKELLEEREQEIKELIPDFTLSEAEAWRTKTERQLEENLSFLGEIKNQLRKQEKLAEMIDSLKKDLHEQRRLLEKTREEENSIRENYYSKRATVDRLTASIPEEIRTKEAFDQKMTATQAKLTFLVEQWEAAQNELQQSEKECSSLKGSLDETALALKGYEEQLRTEKDRFIQLMAENEFTDYQHYEQSKLSEVQKKELQEDIHSFRETLRSVSDRWEELHSLLKDIEKPDIEKIRKELQENELIMNKLQDERAEVLEAAKMNEKIRLAVEQLNESLGELEQKYQVIGDLFNISHGQNTHKLTFERFVLAAFLDDILNAANGRLAKMTSSRYRLLRKTDRAKGNAQSGLELLIFDQYTGQERHVKTLSGGESFKAALALALGLADVVQQYAGGVSLETMFIDEGFGTLDPESLDQAVEALMDIQSSGRMVGIISHVPELKERIDARLEVTSTQAGSHTKFHFYH